MKKSVVALSLMSLLFTGCSLEVNKESPMRLIPGLKNGITKTIKLLF